MLGLVEIKVILGYSMLNLDRAICLGCTCLKVKPVVGGSFRYVTAFIAVFAAKFTWEMKPSNDKTANGILKPKL